MMFHQKSELKEREKLDPAIKQTMDYLSEDNGKASKQIRKNTQKHAKG